MSYNFNVKKATEDCIRWIQDWFRVNGDGCNAVIGISGGKDSSVAAALMCKALGKDRVIGVLMPCGEQFDIDYSKELCEILDIENYTINIKSAVDGIKNEIDGQFNMSEQARVNLSPRIRMSALYAVAQSKNGRVINTCNLSEDWVGYATRYGDGAGDMGPISKFTFQEIKEIGRYLGLPEKFVEKPPLDGLCGKTDEENLGFTYAELDVYIRTGYIADPEKKAIIDRKHKMNLFKLALMPVFQPEL